MSAKLVRMRLAPALEKVMSPWKVYDRCYECHARVPFQQLWRASHRGVMSQPSCSACLAISYLDSLMEANEGERQ